MIVIGRLVTVREAGRYSKVKSDDPSGARCMTPLSSKMLPAAPAQVIRSACVPTPGIAPVRLHVGAVVTSDTLAPPRNGPYRNVSDGTALPYTIGAGDRAST